MKRSELESLSTALLRQLVIDATDVLAARAQGGAAEAGSDGSEAVKPGGLFTFGLASNCGNAVETTAPSRGAPLFGGQTDLHSEELSSSSGGQWTSSKLFGGSGGGLFSAEGASGLFTGSVPAVKQGVTGPSLPPAGGKARAQAEDAESEAEEDIWLVKEEEVLAVNGWTPSMTLEVRDDLETGEEHEEELYCQRSKLYRFRDAEWKERGLGEAKLLKHKASGMIRFLMRQEKTGKVVANHWLVDMSPYCELTKNADNEKIRVWCALDCSESELQVEQFALRFRDAELADKFAEAFDDAKKQNATAAAAGQEPAAAKS